MISRRRDPRVIGSEGGLVDPELERSLEAARGNGTELDPVARADMEGAFGADFGGVRLHADSDSTLLNRALGAEAFTVGGDIFFRDEIPDVSRPSGQALLAHELTHTVQQGAASSVQRQIQRDDDPQGESELLESESDETGEMREVDNESEEEESEGEGESVIEGTIPDASVPPATDELGWGPPEGIVADSTAAIKGTARTRPTKSADSSKGSHRLLDPDINLVTDIVEAPMTGGRLDGITAKPTLNWSAEPGLAVGPFGEMQPNHDFKNMTFKAKSSRSSKTIALKFQIEVICKWGTADGGRADVASGADPIVTADNYNDVAADLTVAQEEKSWVAPRANYYSKALVERHEKYHATDEQKWLNKQGLKLVANYLKTKTVTLTDEERTNPAVVQQKLAPIMADALVQLRNGSDQYYMGGASYYSRPGEERAFGDGKKPYQALAAAVKKQGKQLEKTRARATRAQGAAVT